MQSVISDSIRFKLRIINRRLFKKIAIWKVSNQTLSNIYLKI